MLATSLWVFVLYFWCRPPACGCLCSTFGAGHQPVGVYALLLMQVTSQLGNLLSLFRSTADISHAYTP